ncbi:PREDICTED: U3 small nucleolar RNA-associated protein 18 homolog [Rhagoletis zephyria]|uniref:U3 small nucleolar RNA-associated protein 18 homolog n=1 Tax=Rhagoletis zephyria TaxID=28612 RepID=UPI0008116113|nr:PREDICTED: U3 small nucleolar RNA-associated protein 18 homolog [Rhagoletis zephyria]
MKTKSRPLLEPTMGGGLQNTDDDVLNQLSRFESRDPQQKQSTSRGARQPKKRKLKQKKYDEEEEKLLENIIFGDRSDIISRIDQNVDLISVDTSKDSAGKVNNADELQNQLFIVDKAGDSNLLADDDHQYPQTSGTNRKKNILYELSDDDEFFSSERPKSELTEEEATEKKPAWEDEDDEIKAEEMFDKKKYPKRVNSDDHYKEYLESKFTAVFEPPSWAQKALEKKDKKKKRPHGSVSESDESGDSDDDDELNRMERTARDYSQQRSTVQELDREFLRLKRCTHLNYSSRVKTALNCINFHPNSTVALVGSRVGLVRLFQVDGEENAILQSIYLKGYRLCDAKFLSSNGREEIIVGSDGSSPNSIGLCYYYDMIAGKIVRIKLEKGGHQRYSLRGFQLSPDSQYLAACDNNGQINILSAGSKEHIAELKMNGDVDCLAFSPDSRYLVSHGKGNGCQAYVWDIRNIRSGGGGGCVNRFTDLGTVEATSLAVSSSLCAIGSNMGYVNLYNLEDIVKKAEPQPIKSVSNLTTAVTSLRFNHDGQLLMMASGNKDDAIRFVNTCVGRVYKNFPAYVGGHSGKTYGRIYDIAISPHSGFAAWATGKGTAHLFRINDYFNY